VRDPWAVRPGDLLHMQSAERTGLCFLVLRDGEGEQVIHILEPAVSRHVIGRRTGNSVALEWDGLASRTHCVIERIGDEWSVIDDGLSTNGTFVNGERIAARRRLHDRDVLRVGSTSILFRAPLDGEQATAPGSVLPDVTGVTDAQRRILVALCRPCLGAGSMAMPATNAQVGAELHLSAEAVKAQLRTLFRRFGVDGLPQNAKRVRLAQLAIRSGIVSHRDL
jgi:DNA-binding CsgD family transcriptional regulator